MSDAFNSTKADQTVWWLKKTVSDKSNNTNDILAMSSRSAASNITASSCSVGTRWIGLAGDSSLPSRRRCRGSSWVVAEPRRARPLVLVLQFQVTTYIISVLLYRAETYTLQTSDWRRSDAFHHLCQKMYRPDKVVWSYLQSKSHQLDRIILHWAHHLLPLPGSFWIRGSVGYQCPH